MPAARICTLHISLIGSDPEIWRQRDIPTDFTLDTLNGYRPGAMGWTGDHRWEFARGRERFAPPADRAPPVAAGHHLSAAGRRERNAPPEECGGINAFYHQPAALAEPDCDPERRAGMDEYDPVTLDAARIGYRLTAIAREVEQARAKRPAPLAPRRRSTKA